MLIAIVPVNTADASKPAGQFPTLKVRKGEHPSFIRYVFEGPDSVISGVKVREEGGNIIIKFPSKGFRLHSSKAIKHESDRVIIAGSGGSIKKVFSLDNPDRLVVDILRKSGPGGKKKKKKARASKKTEKPAADLKAREKESTETAQKRTERTSKETKSFSVQVPEKYRKVWTLLKSGNPYGVLSVLPEYPPAGREDAAFYHYIYGVAFGGAKQYLRAIEHLRLAHILATGPALRERALIKRADVQLQGGFVYEALADYKLFLKEFPSSIHREEVHLGLAECLMRVGKYREAIRHYDKVEQSAEILYRKANAYQRVGKVRKASGIYVKALKMDPDFPDKDEETAYLLGENFRMQGKYTEARKRLAGIIIGIYRDEARISRGLMAMEDGDFDEAIRLFQTALMSRDRKIKVKALFNLSVVYARSGKTEKAIETLEEIRTKHIDSFYYKDTLLALAKLYRRTGRIEQSVYMLKELVYGKQPPAQAFRELEDIVSEMARKDDVEADGGLTFRKLWREVGQWLVDRSREKFLLKVARRLRYEGSPFIDLTLWMIENTSPAIRTEAAVLLADYYIEVGDEELAEKYITFTTAPYPPSDMAKRVKARIFIARDMHKKAIRELSRIKDFRKDDMGILLRIIRKTRQSGSGLTEKAIALYERRLAKKEWSADEYIGLADILYSMGRRSQASKYIRKAYQKNPDDEWVMYRMAHDVDRSRSRDMFARLGSGNSLLSRLAKTRIMEMNLLNRVSEVY